MPLQLSRQHYEDQLKLGANAGYETPNLPYYKLNEESLVPSETVDNNTNNNNNNHRFNLHGQAQPAKLVDATCNCRCKMKLLSANNGQAAEGFVKKYLNIRYIGFLLFVLASCYCVYRLINPHEGDRGPPAIRFSSQLKLVSLFNRHGDRAPSDALPSGDPHAQWAQQIWPNGQNNLTDLGKFRQYRIGLELRHRYQSYLDFNSASYLAFSSSMYRCQESLSETLRGLFSNEWPISMGLQLASEYSSANCSLNSNCPLKSKLPAGFIWPNEYKNITIDTRTFPMLKYEYLNKCKYRLAHPTPVDVDLRSSKAVRDLPGLDELARVLETKYQIKLNFTALGLWSTIANELRLIKSGDTLDWLRNQFDWVNKPVGFNETTAANGNKHNKSSGKRRPATLLDLHEQVAVFGYRDRIVDTANLIQLGPLVSSLLDSQRAALEGSTVAPYGNKRMIFYSSHDSILQLLLHGLNIIDAREQELSFERRFDRWASAGDHEQLLAGLRMSKFGMSLVFELWQAQEELDPQVALQDDHHDHQQSNKTNGVNKLAYVQAYLYNREEALGQIDYKRLEFGSICRKLFNKLYPNESGKQMESSFYSNFAQFKLSEKFSCPFELFQNVTSKYRISAKQLSDLCD